MLHIYRSLTFHKYPYSAVYHLKSPNCSKSALISVSLSSHMLLAVLTVLSKLFDEIKLLEDVFFVGK